MRRQHEPTKRRCRPVSDLRWESLERLSRIVERDLELHPDALVAGFMPETSPSLLLGTDELPVSIAKYVWEPRSGCIVLGSSCRYAAGATVDCGLVDYSYHAGPCPLRFRIARRIPQKEKSPPRDFLRTLRRWPFYYEVTTD